VIILRMPRRVDGKSLRDYILLQVKKFRKNKEHRYIKLEGEVAYSDEHVFFIFPDRALELAFALSMLFKCQRHIIPCTLEVSKPIEIEKLPDNIIKCAEVWSERKLPRRCYKLRRVNNL